MVVDCSCSNVPGCQEHHGIWLDQPNTVGSQWTWNNSVESPTFSPSFVNKTHDQDGIVKSVCHMYVRDGNLVYLDDSTHSMRSKCISMEPIR